MRNRALARFVKLPGKTSIVEFNFIKVAGQKSDAVIDMKLFLNVFWNYWKGWQHEVKGKSKFTVYIFETVAYVDRQILVENQNVPYRGKYRWGKVANFSWNFVAFPVEKFLRGKIFPMKFFVVETLYLPNTFFWVKIKV